MSTYRFETLQLHAGQEVEPHNPFTLCRFIKLHLIHSKLWAWCQLFALKRVRQHLHRIMNPHRCVREAHCRFGGWRCCFTQQLVLDKPHSLWRSTTFCRQVTIFVSTSFVYGGTYNQFKVAFKVGRWSSFCWRRQPWTIWKLIDSKLKPFYIEPLATRFQHSDFDALAGSLRNMICLWLSITHLALPDFVHSNHSDMANVVVESANKMDWRSRNINGWRDRGWRKLQLEQRKIPAIHWAFWRLSRFEVLGCFWFNNPAWATQHRLHYSHALKDWDFGPALAPFNSFLFLQGLETFVALNVLLKTALKLAGVVGKNPNVESVNYPGLKSAPIMSLRKIFKEWIRCCALIRHERLERKYHTTGGQP